MGTRHPNPRLVKTHRSYDVAELARLFVVHRNTIRAWRKVGLTPIDDRRPILFTGVAVRAFLEARRATGKRPCGPRELYCLRCHAPRQPALDMVELTPTTPTSGDLQALCATCECVMHKRVNLARFRAEAAFPDAQVRPAPPTVSRHGLRNLVRCLAKFLPAMAGLKRRNTRGGDRRGEL